MNLIKSASCVVLSIAVLSPVFAAQSGNDRKASTRNQSKQSVEQKQLDPSAKKVLSIIGQLLEANKSVADENLRIVIRTQIADLMWTLDQPRSRRLFGDAVRELCAAAPGRVRFMSSSGPLHSPVASVVAQMIVQRDPALAVELNGILVDSPQAGDTKAAAGPYVPYFRSQLAFFLSHSKPELMAEVVKPFAEQGDLLNLIPTLRTLRSKNQETENQLLIVAVEKAKLRQVTFEEIKALAAYIFPQFTQGVVFPSPGNSRANEPIKVPRALLDQFFALTYDVVTRLDPSATTSDGTGPRIEYAILKLLMPYFDRHSPDNAASFRARVEAILRSAPAEIHASLQALDVTTVDELVAKADVLVDVREKDRIYMRASTIAIASGDLDRAAATAEKIQDARLRANAAQNVRVRTDQRRPQEVFAALQKGDWDSAASIAASVSFPHSRVHLLGTVIERILHKDKALANSFFDDAVQRASRRENRFERALELIMLARVAAKLDVDRGFDTMRLAIEEFNNAGFLREWQRTDPPGTGDTSLEEPVRNGLSNLLSDESFAFFGGVDFDRALDLARQMQPTEASYLAELAVCRGVMGKLQVAAPSKGAPSR